MADRNGEFDTRIAIITPENIAFDYRVAGPFQRLPAYFLDVLIRASAFLVVLVLALVGFGLEIGAAWGLVAFFTLDIFYGGFFETIWNGQTPGKRFTGLRVVTVSGEPINASQAVLRNILRIADGFPLLGPLLIPTFQVGMLAAMMNNRYQRLGDLVCGTIVISEEQEGMYGVTRVMEPEAIRLAAELPLHFDVSRSLGLALSSYVQRRVMFGWARREEISRHLGEPLRQRLGLESIPSYDLLLCAVYHKAFVEEQPRAQPAAAMPQGEPFAAHPVGQGPFGQGPMGQTPFGQPAGYPLQPGPAADPAAPFPPIRP